MKIKKILAVTCACLIGMTAVGIAEVSDVISDDFAAITANAADLTSGFWQYSVNSDGTVNIKGYTGFADTLNIPSKIDGMTVTAIGDYAFKNSTNFDSVVIPSTVTSIGYQAFYESGLKSVTVPSTVKSCENYTFYNCDQLTTVVFNAETIPFAAFGGCDKLKTVTSSAKYIGREAFHSCGNLSSFTNKNYLLEIGNYAFKNCSSLTSFDMGNKLTYIGREAFRDTALKSVTVPSSVNSFENYTFDDCKNLNTIYFGYNTMPNYIINTSGVTFYCYPNTDALQYAKDNAIPYKLRTAVASTAIKLNKTSLTMEVGDTYVLEAVLTPLNSTDGITWVSGDTNIATVNSAGIVTAKSEGLVSIKATTTSGKNAICNIKVIKPCTTHTWDSGKVTKAATYGATGVKTYTCKVCGATKTASVAKKTVKKLTAKTTYTCTTNAVRINWNKLSGVTGYKIFRYDDAKKKWVAVKAIYDPNVTNYKISGLKSGKVYKFRVKAFVKENGKFYFGESCSTISTATRPNTTTVTKANKTSTAVRLFWKKTTCSGYRILRYDSAKKKWVRVTAVGSSATTQYKISGLKKNTTYKFKVQPYVKVGSKVIDGAASAVFTVKTSK